MSMDISQPHSATGPDELRPIKGFRVALEEITEALAKYRLALIFGWQDVAQRYRRSRVGAFWLTLNMAVFVSALGAIFGTLFQSQMSDFLPYLCSGIIMWGFISTSLSEGCNTFINASGMILQIRLPFFIHVMRTIWRNLIILGHNIIIFPIVALVMGKAITFHALWAIPGLVLICLNLSWMILVLATLCARYRDMTQVLTNILQVLFYATPIMWMEKTLPAHVSRLFIDVNPFYHLIQLVRAPLFGVAPTVLDWSVAIGMAICGWIFALIFFGKYRCRVAYWL